MRFPVEGPRASFSINVPRKWDFSQSEAKSACNKVIVFFFFN